MLGHIFENLLEDNKDKGAYYTPKAIVSYMARQSLLHYLQTHLGENAELITLLNEKDLTRHRKDGFVHQHAKRIAELLDAVKVCDPAIGSGAFPIGVLQEILWTRLALDWTLNTPEDRARLKRQHHPKQHPRRRSRPRSRRDRPPPLLAVPSSWMKNSRSPLPNLDYKIMQGDGLLEWFEGIDLSKISEAGGGQSPYMMTFLDGGSELNLGADTSGGRLVTAQTPASDLPQMMKTYFNCRKPAEKKRLHREIDRTVLDHLKHCVDAFIEKTEALIDQQRKVIAGKLIRPKNWHPTKAEKLISGLKDRLHELKAAREKLVNLYEHHTRPFFLWHLLFQSVFKEGGFDIVIANPPYVRADNPDALVERKKVEATGLYHTLWEKWDLYVAFIERGYQLLKPGGTLCNIVSDAYCHSKYAQKSQDWFLKNARVLRLDFLADLKVFDAAVRNVICLYQKADGQDHHPARRLHRQRFGNVTELPTQSQQEASYRLFFPGEKKTAEFDVETVPLEDICYISVGMVAHADEKRCPGAFILEDLVADKKSKTHPKPFAEGKHLSRWVASTHKWIEWDTKRAPELFRRPTFPELYAVPEKLISVDISAGAGKLRVAYDQAGLLHNHSAWSFVPWHYLKGVTNRSLAKQAKYRRERPNPLDRSREALESLSEDFEAKYLLAVMNSNVARDWIMSRRRSNLHLYPDDWKPLPVPKARNASQKRIVKLVDHVLKALRSNIQSDITDLEAAIEAEIAALYNSK
jgi:adenine-specific DNA-methyltransferase